MRPRPSNANNSQGMHQPIIARQEGEQLGTNYYVRESKVALPLLPVVVSSPESGKVVQTYALLDSGSNVSLCDEKLFKDLGVAGQREALKLTTLEREESEFLTTVTSLTVRGKDGSTAVRLPRVFSRKGLNLKQESLVTRKEVERWPHLRDLPLPGAKAGDIRLLIGQDCPRALAPLSTILGAEGEPFAVKTCLGWTVNGPIVEGEPNQRPTACSTQAEAIHRLSDQVDKFWRLESGGVFDQEKAMSASDEAVVRRWSEAAEYEDPGLPRTGPHQQATRGAAQIQVAPGSSHGGHRGHVPPGKGEDIRSRRAAIPVVERR